MQDNAVTNFTRSTKRDGLFSWPTIIFQLTRSQDGAETGQFSIRKNIAAYTSANHRDDFRLRRNFWTNRWMYEDGAERLFARISIGFKTSIIFADDTRFQLKIKRRWPWRRKAGEYKHLATFFRDETPVMILQNNQRMPFFSSEVHTPMSGTITTDLTDAYIICGLLLLFQSSLVRRQAAASGA